MENTNAKIAKLRKEISNQIKDPSIKARLLFTTSLTPLN